MSHPQPLGFAIVGVGMIADYHARAISDTAGGRLVAVVGRDQAKTAAFAERHRIPVATTDLAGVLARDDVQVVCIATPSGAHLEPALAAARAGKHLVVEKPVEITPDRADQLLNTSRDAGVKVAAIFQARFGTGAVAVKQAIDGGHLGRLVLASAYVKWYRKPEYYTGWKGTLKLDGGGAVINQSIHGLDLLQWFVGLPAEVFAWKTRRVHLGIEAEDTACASLRYESGALGAFEATTAAFPGWQRRIEICGEKGSLALEDDVITKWDLPAAAGPKPAAPDAGMQGGSSAPNAISHVGHLRQIQNLIDHLIGGTPLAVNGAEARRAVSLVDAIYRSANEGRPVTLR